jgi:hypothetical protein
VLATTMATEEGEWSAGQGLAGAVEMTTVVMIDCSNSFHHLHHHCLLLLLVHPM